MTGRLIKPMGGCIATHRIMVDGRRVGWMERCPTDRKSDSGWCFYAGDETQDYLEELSNASVYDVDEVAQHDRDIIPFLFALPGQRFERDPETGAFVEMADSQPDQSAERAPAGVHVVQDHFQIAERWSIRLPTPFRQRHEDTSLVLWRPRLTFWIWGPGPGGRIEDTMRELRARISPNAEQLVVDELRGARRLSYRLREDSTDAGLPSLYTYVVRSDGHLQVAAYFDDETELCAARKILDSLGE